MIEQALEHHRAGRLQQAEVIYRQILRKKPDHPDALHLLGVIALQTGKHEAAATLIGRAVELNPNVPAYHNNLAEALQALHRLDEAVATYQQALVLKPDLAEIHNKLGIAFQEQGELAKAIAAFRRALTVEADFAEAHYNLGNALHESGQLAEAVSAYRQAIALEPDDAEAFNNLGVALKDQGEFAEAITAFERALALNPNSAGIHVNLGNARHAQGQLVEAISSYEQALAIKPNDATTHNRLGRVLDRQGRLDKAIAAYKQALAIAPDYVEAYNNLGKALAAVGELEQAVDAFRQALQRNPDLISTRLRLVSTLRFVKPARYEPDLENELKKCLSCPEVNPQDLARSIANQLKHKHRMRHGPTSSDRDMRALATSLGTDELLITLLSKTVNVDAELELLLTDIRRMFLFDYLNAAEIPGTHMGLIVALGLQCFSNEYLFNVQPDEAEAVDRLVKHCERSSERVPLLCETLENHLVLLAMYQPLYELDCAHVLSAPSLNEWSDPVQPLIERVLIEPLQEAGLETDIVSFGKIQDGTSQAVRVQYEEHPYPRWLNLPRTRKVTMRTFLSRTFPYAALPEFLDGPMCVLVAGCGTGREPISIALACENIEILAVDLSRRSLAYAERMARKFETENISFQHGDILELAGLNQHFHMIECGGVLHHMDEPVKAWHKLTELLVTDGVMKIGLYSERARKAVVAARTQIEQQGMTAVSHDIKAFRRDILTRGTESRLAALTESEDFYTLSTCRDLLFHTTERRFTLPQIRQALDELGLEFIGFELPTTGIKQRYHELFPHDEQMVDLAAWDTFEQLHPETFAGMYVFWCQKADTSSKR
ncbi:MAG: tetratricopeptide repeat protein [Acidiferrobacterales bacterium]